ncbi:MAG: dihydroorotase [Parvibaculales bacterium]
MTLFFENARYVNPQNSKLEKTHILVEKGKISAMGEKIKKPEGTKIISCKGKILLPGLVDMQVFAGEPGGEHRETLASASHAAAAGGVTNMVTSPATNPTIDSVPLVDFIMRRARDTAIVHVHPMACITKNMEGKTMTEFFLLKEAGATAFSDGTNTLMDALVMRRVMEYAAMLDALLVQHVCDASLAAAGCMHEGELSLRLGLKGIPDAAELMMIDRDIRLIEQTGARYHIAQISSAKSVETLRNAKARGLKITASVSVHHLLLNEMDVQEYRSFAKLDPPLRSEEDRIALLEGVRDGTIDTIISAHMPQSEEAKRHPFEHAAYGSIGVETLLPAALSLYHEKSVPLARLIDALSTRPANILHIDGGSLEAGAPANIVLIDIDAPFIVDTDKLHSKSKNAVLEGRHLQGIVEKTFLNGKEIYSHA